jgi:PHS family inorganic phosphate transporter-like MFS transporter
MPHNADTSIKVATSAGAIFGQCIFGYLGDYLGRKKMYGVELMIIISTTLAQSLCGESTTLSIVGVLIFYRVVMGIGVGGDCRYILEAADMTQSIVETENFANIFRSSQCRHYS